MVMLLLWMADDALDSGSLFSLAFLACSAIIVSSVGGAPPRTVAVVAFLSDVNVAMALRFCEVVS